MGLADCDDSFSLQRLGPPVISTQSCLFTKAACCTALVAYMVCASAASSTHDVHGFARAFTH
jgi:hypothetical protein